MPGGARFADAVREHDGRLGLRPATAHRMAILGMDQFGWLLSDLIPGGLSCTELPSARAAAARGETPVLLPAALLAGDPLPSSWAVSTVEGRAAMNPPFSAPVEVATIRSGRIRRS